MGSRLLVGLTGAGVLVALVAGDAAAQGRTFLSLGAGATIPTSDYGDYAKTGWMGGLGVGTAVGSGNMFVMASGFFGKNSHEGEDNSSTTLMGGGANIGMMSSGERARLYGYVGGGLQNHKYNPSGDDEGDSEAKPYANGWVGVSLGSAKARPWIQGGMVMGLGGEKTSYFGVMAGISIGW